MRKRKWLKIAPGDDWKDRYGYQRIQVALRILVTPQLTSPGWRVVCFASEEFGLMKDFTDDAALTAEEKATTAFNSLQDGVTIESLKSLGFVEVLPW